jgi:hypothetical protein
VGWQELDRTQIHQIRARKLNSNLKRIMLTRCARILETKIKGFEVHAVVMDKELHDLKSKWARRKTQP